MLILLQILRLYHELNVDKKFWATGKARFHGKIPVVIYTVV
jgi:hypothetical protein